MENEKIRKSINNNFSDLDPTENTAEVFQIIREPFPGKHKISCSDSYGTPITSKKFNKTGGLEYSYGVELETSQGLMDKSLVRKLGLLCCGDRSIGSGEYVTSPLLGNEGLKYLENICKALSECTLVDDRCAIHIHVGGVDGFKSPSFDRDFLINSIKLGCFIEEELYSAMPPSRKPTLYHCHSIRRYEEIDKSNFDSFMGAFIFGPKEYWLSPTENCPHPLFNFDDYKLDGRRNSKTKIATWQDGRYKWLNLINAFSDAVPHKTIEFRIFSPTTNFQKVYAYLMFSLAFVHLVNEKPKLIKKGITLDNLFDAAFSKHPDICAWLKSFYALRKQKFNRTNIYPKNLSFLK